MPVDTCRCRPGGDNDRFGVYDICIKPALALNPEPAVKHAASLMGAHRIKRLPVTDDNSLCGIPTMNDLVDDILTMMD